MFLLRRYWRCVQETMSNFHSADTFNLLSPKLCMDHDVLDHLNNFFFTVAEIIGLVFSVLIFFHVYNWNAYYRIFLSNVHSLQHTYLTHFQFCNQDVQIFPINQSLIGRNHLILCWSTLVCYCFSHIIFFLLFLLFCFHSHLFIYPSITFTNYQSGSYKMEIIPADFGWEMGYTLTRSPIS